MSLTVLEGLRPWLIQRVSAVVIALYLVYVVATIGVHGAFDYAGWRAWVHAPYNSLFMGLFVLALLFHAWIGMRDVILDYVHNVLLRLLIFSIIVSVLLISGLWSLRILLLPLVAQ